MTYYLGYLQIDKMKNYRYKYFVKIPESNSF